MTEKATEKTITKKRGEKPAFEKAMSRLEASAEALKQEGITLEAALKSFEEGMEYYRQCSDILSDARQRISICTEEGEVEEE